MIRLQRTPITWWQECGRMCSKLSLILDLSKQKLKNAEEMSLSIISFFNVFVSHTFDFMVIDIQPLALLQSYHLVQMYKKIWLVKMRILIFTQLIGYFNVNYCCQHYHKHPSEQASRQLSTIKCHWETFGVYGQINWNRSIFTHKEIKQAYTLIRESSNRFFNHQLLLTLCVCACVGACYSLVTTSYHWLLVSCWWWW